MVYLIEKTMQTINKDTVQITENIVQLLSNIECMFVGK